MQNSAFWTRVTSLYGSQPSPVVLCVENSNFSTWITSLYGSQPSSEVFACKPATFGPKLYVSMGPRTHLWFSAWKTACLASELLVSMDPSPHLWFLHAKQRLLGQKYKYLCVPALICGFCMHNSAFWTWISSLYGSQTSSVILSTHKCVLYTRIKRLNGFQPSPVVLCMQNSDFSTWIASLYWSQPSSVFLHAKQRLLDPNNKSLWVPDITYRFVHAIQRD